jgi:hypothetical protein
MTASAVERFIRSMEEQGVGVTRTTKGLLLRLPDGETTSLHFTNSDVRAPINLMARLRRAGVRHPDDPKDVRELPSNITQGPAVAARTKQKVIDYIVDNDFPEVVTVKELVDHTEMVHITATRAMYQMGFTPVKGKRGARDWIVPQEILDKKPVEPVEEEPESPTLPPLTLAEAEAYEEAMNPTRDEAEVARLKNLGAMAGEKPEREFIDTHDSWIVDLRQFTAWGGGQNVTVEDMVKVLRASGLQVEVRVWRA